MVETKKTPATLAPSKVQHSWLPLASVGGELRRADIDTAESWGDSGSQMPPLQFGRYRRNCPVSERFAFNSSAGVPSTTTWPPLLPPSGPESLEWLDKQPRTSFWTSSMHNIGDSLRTADSARWEATLSIDSSIREGSR